MPVEFEPHPVQYSDPVRRSFLVFRKKWLKQSVGPGKTVSRRSLIRPQIECFEPSASPSRRQLLPDRLVKKR
jgi:hypothetical protein